MKIIVTLFCFQSQCIHMYTQVKLYGYLDNMINMYIEIPIKRFGKPQSKTEYVSYRAWNNND